MKSKKVIAIGEGLIDRLGPPGGDPSIDLPVIDCFGGAPANVACGLSRLGVDVSFIGSFGNDEFGKNFKNLMIQRGINTSGLQQDDSRPTRIVLVRRDINGERSFEGFQGDQGLGFADQALSREKIINDWHLISDEAQWLVIGSIPLASESSSEAFLWCIDQSIKAGMQVALDLNWRPTFWRNKLTKDLSPNLEEKKKINSILDNVSLIKVAKEEAIWFFNSSDPLDISSGLPQRPSVIITDGSNPISWLINKNSGKSYAIRPSSIVDTTGAGDAFTAGLLYKLLSYDLDQINNNTAEQIIQFAVACGAYVCKGLGAIDSQPYLDDVDKFLLLHAGGIN
jgi:fructokinase